MDYSQESIAPSPISSTHSGPHQLLEPYHFHNAPEVIPPAGLEYDDSIHPHSDKFPVIHSSQSSASTVKARSIEAGKPPLIIFGMKPPTFFVVSIVVLLVIIGAAVGGALGRPKAAPSMQVATSASSLLPAWPNQTLMPNITSPTSAMAKTSTFNAPIPTYTVLDDCPQSNNTLYTTDPVSSASDGPRYNYTKHCGLDSPLSQSAARTLAQAYVYSFNDCIQFCASLNFFEDSENCTTAVFVLARSRPANCFVGAADVSRGATAFAARQGVNVAMLQEVS